jgi:hypothetical protein
MIFFDFIEIGTSDFDTLIQSANNTDYGLSIEPIKFYLDRLPNKQNIKKINCAISTINSTCNMYYVPLDIIHKWNLPNWVRGCNSINEYHVTVHNYCKKENIDIEKIIECDEIPVKTLFAIMNECNIKYVYYLKIDTEGHDCLILKKFYEDIINNNNNNNNNLPHVIQFETNVLTNNDDVSEIIELYKNIGYDFIYKTLSDTLLKLNLNKIKNKTHYVETKNYYFDNDEIISFDTLDLAKEFCDQNNSTGIMFTNNKYNVYDSKYLEKYEKTNDNDNTYIYM